jgi:hypothetical protein
LLIHCTTACIGMIAARGIKPGINSISTTPPPKPNTAVISDVAKPAKAKIIKSAKFAIALLPFG